jgi:hypothetical protein
MLVFPAGRGRQLLFSGLYRVLWLLALVTKTERLVIFPSCIDW